MKRFLHPITQSKIMCLSGVKSAAKNEERIESSSAIFPFWVEPTHVDVFYVPEGISDYEIAIVVQ